MKTYLVGGAVRDRLLGLEVRERDWVVVGATADELLKQGYKEVGRSFPVFLHPETQEEYALARRETKTAPGYRGFEVDFGPEVTLEEDLMRRDLTINAMAGDDAGRLVDPYGGERDLAEKVLRHVSPAFREDPVRILRVARFAARFDGQGFRIAPETMALMREMVAQGEAAALVPERVWQETVRALGEDAPQRFFTQLLHDPDHGVGLADRNGLVEGPVVQLDGGQILGEQHGGAANQFHAHPGQFDPPPHVRLDERGVHVRHPGELARHSQRRLAHDLAHPFVEEVGGTEQGDDVLDPFVPNAGQQGDASAPAASHEAEALGFCLRRNRQRDVQQRERIVHVVVPVPAGTG